VIEMTGIIVKKTDRLSGTVEAPPSKAHTHRAIIAASLSEGHSSIRNPLICDDTLATQEACIMLGARIERVDGNLEINGISKPLTPEDVINCGDSGSTIRFLTPVCALADGISILTGGKSLRKRPMGPLLKALSDLGVRCYSANLNGFPPIVVFGGGIGGGRTSIRGDVSSQFISGLLFATPKADGDTEMALSTRLESKPYVNLTMDFLKKHGVEVHLDTNSERFIIPCKQRYVPFDHVIEGDYSSAAFLLSAAALIDSQVRVNNLKQDTLQGDRVIVDILEEMGVHIVVGEDLIEIEGVGHGLEGLSIDLQDNPDLVPICTVLACFARGESVIHGVSRLRFKESDRIASVISELGKMGAKLTASKDSLIILGGSKLHGAELDCHNDHRISMACTIAALRAEGTTLIQGIESINKSYPNFVKDIILLGGNAVER